MTDLYLGLISGTSADGIDAALVDFSHLYPKVVATHYTPYPTVLREKIFSLCQKGENEIHRLGELDVVIAKEFAQAANNLLKQHAISPDKVKAIGSHGQNIRHHPHSPHRFTLQIGDPNTIASETGITTVADFRRKDIALGGQGAPLVPAFHQHVFAADQVDRTIVNIGGIANITLLPKNNPGPIVGFDTGPGNGMMDAWINDIFNEPYDKNGAWGLQGTVDEKLLQNFLADSYFRKAPPKSTGREYFNLDWVKKHLDQVGGKIAPVDVQTTLVELTARTIIDAILHYLAAGEILVCGGGAHNAFLLTRLRDLGKPHFQVETTQKYGVDPDWVEAMAFAWLARQTMNRLPGNLPSVTGAKLPAVLGGVYFAN